MVFSLIMVLMIDELLRALQEGCFRYFQLGGRCITDPVGLLSGYIHVCPS